MQNFDITVNNSTSYFAWHIKLPNNRNLFPVDIILSCYTILLYSKSAHIIKDFRAFLSVPPLKFHSGENDYRKLSSLSIREFAKVLFKLTAFCYFTWDLLKFWFLIGFNALGNLFFEFTKKIR